MIEEPVHGWDNFIKTLKRELISKFVNDLKRMKNELGTDYFDYYIKKWEIK